MSDNSIDTNILLEVLYTGQYIHVGNCGNSPIESVKQLVNKPTFGQHAARPVFCEMYELSDTFDLEGKEYRWLESARWIKYEETVEEGGKRWSKPHITLLTLPGLLQLRNCLKRGTLLLDADVKNFRQLIDLLISNWTEQNQIQANERRIIEEVLLSPKHHLVRSRFRDRDPQNTEAETYSFTFASRQTDTAILDSCSGSLRDDLSANNLATAPPSPLCGSENGKSPQMLKPPRTTKNSVSGTSSPKPISAKDRMMRKIPKGAEAANVFVGKVHGLSQPMSAFLRLSEGVVFSDVPEVPIPSRFVFILLIPANAYGDREISFVGRTLGVLFADEIFSTLAYRCKDSVQLYYAIDEFLSQTILIPAGRWSLELRLEPNHKALVTREVGKPISRQFSVAHGHEMDQGLRRTGTLFGGLVQDLRRKVPLYCSDFRDAFKPSSFTQCLAASIFLFFANITKIITFGGVMESMLKKNMAAMENLLSGGICGVLYALFSGQPLAVLSATGPTLVFESILFRFCTSAGWSFLPSRFWVGVWTSFFIMVLVGLDASVVVSLITKFTEEAFATLISLIFIIQAFEELWHISYYAPITPASKVQEVLIDPCLCNLTQQTNNLSASSSSHILHAARSWSSPDQLYPAMLSNVSRSECVAIGGSAEGLQCDFHPDVFPFCIVLFMGTFIISYGMKMFRHSGYLPCRIRNTIADFGVFVAIVIMTVVNYFVGLDVPTLNVPTEFRPTLNRSWLVDPLDLSHWWIPLACAIPALFFTVLVVMDQQITSVIVNRKENKLKKGFGYHLDLLVIALLMIVCSLIGIPYYVAATVISIMHVESLKTMTESTAPGEKPQFLGVREQRVTALIAHTLIGLAVFLTPVIRLVPVPVLLGIFLYTGVVALSGQQFAQRLTLFFKPVKYQPDLKFLCLVPLKKVHLFTVIQLFSLLLLFAVKYTKQISMLFPVMLVVMVVVRKLMDRIFKQEELLALDDPLPTWKEMMRPSRADFAPKTNKSGTDDVLKKKTSSISNGGVGNKPSLNGLKDSNGEFLLPPTPRKTPSKVTIDGSVVAISDEEEQQRLLTPSPNKPFNSLSSNEGRIQSSSRLV